MLYRFSVISVVIMIMASILITGCNGKSKDLSGYWIEEHESSEEPGLMIFFALEVKNNSFALSKAPAEPFYTNGLVTGTGSVEKKEDGFDLYLDNGKWKTHSPLFALISDSGERVQISSYDDWGGFSMKRVNKTEFERFVNDHFYTDVDVFSFEITPSESE